MVKAMETARKAARRAQEATYEGLCTIYVVQTETAAVQAQGVKLFLAPEIVISSNSKIVVTQNGVTDEYSASGIPAIYSTHQEITLESFRGWA